MKKRRYIRKQWSEENICFYLCFEGEEAIKQIEVSSNNIIILSKENPINGEYFLYDQKLSDLELEPDDFITENVFQEIWNRGLNNLK